MKKYNSIRITDTEGNTIFTGSYTQLLKKFKTKEECDEYIEDCKEKGYDYNTSTIYYDFEYDNPNTHLSNNWLEDISSEIPYENNRELIEGIIKLSFKDIKNVRCEYVGDKYCLIVLPKQYDSLLLYRSNDVDHKFFAKLLREIYSNMNDHHNKTMNPKIRVAEFVNDWRTKIRYADYNEGYTFYYNSIPQENKLKLLFK